MQSPQLLKTTAGYVVTTFVLVGIVGSSSSIQAQDAYETSLIQRGFEIAPVPLNLAGLDRNLVGLGSYLVNAVGDCNGCHTSGGPPNFNYAAGGNPYFSQPTKVDPTTYLAGGSDFGPVSPPVGPAMYSGPDIIARNLTPDKTGMAAGGHTLSDFKQLMTTGIDYDKLHPTCIAVTPTPTPANCIPASSFNPVNGSLLQVMPWPTFANMSDHDLNAIYAYLSAIPCIAGPTDPTDPLHNDCGSGSSGGGGTGGVTIAISGPGAVSGSANTFQTVVSVITLDASKSTSSNAGALTYSWTAVPGYPSIGITGGSTATATVSLGGGKGTYQIKLTTTDSKGVSAVATVVIQFV